MDTKNITKVDFSDEFRKSYIDYAMSVITSRALPDARDGLKPVQRRLLYDMYDLHVNHDKPTKKSARIVGDTMGKYHPHGDSSCYDALVVMAQDFKKNVPLVHGQGNMGSVEGDCAAAQRYTEVKLERFTEDVLLKDLDSTVPFISNYDDTEKEPEVLPARLPMMLVNGSEGIAVGMNTSTPSHNVSEICDLCKAYVSNQKLSVADMLKIMPGPDFPTGGIIANKRDLMEIYESGTGKIKIRGKIEIEKASSKKEHDKLIITEIPYTMIGSGIEKFMMDIASLVSMKVLPEVLDISNQSSKEGIRIVLDVKNGADLSRIENILYKKTKLEDTFGVNMIAIHNNKPETLPLPKMLSIWYDFQKEILRKKYSDLLKKANVKREIQEGLIKACDCIDLIIEILRGSKTVQTVKKCLIHGITDDISFKTKSSKSKAGKLSFTESQAEAILQMRMQKLIGLELEILRSDYEKTLKDIAEYELILTNSTKLNSVIKKELDKLKKDFSTPRKTRIMDCEEAVYEEKQESFECFFLMDRFGYCKLIDLATYERNESSIQEQYKFCVKTSSDKKIYIFTDAGILYQIKCSSVPLCKYKDKGEPLEKLSSYTGNQNIIFLSHSDCEDELLFISERGYIKKVDTLDFNSSKKELTATKLSENDKIAFILPMNTAKYLILSTKAGYVLKLNSSDIPKMKRTALGIKGMDVKDSPISFAALVNNTDIIQIFNQSIRAGEIKANKRGNSGKQIKKEN